MSRLLPIAGLLLGGFVVVFALALCAVARRADDAAERSVQPPAAARRGRRVLIAWGRIPSRRARRRLVITRELDRWF